MADRRKLQSEIDRCLKKVSEGVETFEDIWQKVHNATNTNQKEKYEADLKKEIKKLQRLRDQIKTWCASSEIKDKRTLTENRKLIETQMERFKVVERETKTKAYSKEGLGAAQKLDPIQKEKDEITNWLSNSIDTLSVQVDQFESEIEALLIGQKKSKKDRDKQGRSEVLKKRLEKHRYHIKQLETLMRMLDNETVEVDQIKKIKDDIEYYIESSQEDDFLDNEFIYDDLDLEDMIAFRANNVVDSNNALAKSSSTTSASKSEANNSSTAASVENDDINAQSNSSSSANESPSPSPGLVNSHSNKATTNSSPEFAFITSNLPPPPSPSIPTVTTTISTVIPSSSNKTVWSNSNATTNRGSSNTSIQTTNSATSTPYAAAASVTSLAISSAKIVQENEMLNEARLQTNNASNSSLHHDVSVHHPSTSTVVTLYSAAAAAAASSVTSTASVSNNPWSNTVSGSNSCDSTNHQILASRQISTSGSSQLTAQQQLLLQQQQNSHLFNGFKGISMEHQNISSLKSVSQQVVSSSLDEHIDNSMMNSLNINIANLNISSNNGGNTSNSLNQIVHMNDMSNSGQNATSNATAMHVDHPNLFVKNNLLIHQQNSQIIQTNPPASSVSPSINLNSVSSVPTNLSNNYSSNNISNVESSMNCSSTVNTSVNTTLVNSTSQSQSQIFYPVSSAKSNIPKSFLYQTHLLESAFQHPIIPLDSHRLKPLTKMSPTITTPIPMSNYPNQNMSQFDKLEFYQRMTPETLFFIFYYMEGTKAQYMAAKTLKNKSWRFHTKFMMWFQRLEEPKVISEDYEQGTYIFFDYERWAQRKKEGFVFEYKYLEDKELN